MIAGRLPDAPFALELVQLVAVGLWRQLSGENVTLKTLGRSLFRGGHVKSDVIFLWLKELD